MTMVRDYRSLSTVERPSEAGLFICVTNAMLYSRSTEIYSQ